MKYDYRAKNKNNKFRCSEFGTIHVKIEFLRNLQTKTSSKFQRRIETMPPTLHNGGVGPLLDRTASSSSRNEQPGASRAGRRKNVPQHECSKPLISKQGSFRRTQSTERKYHQTITPVPCVARASEFSSVTSMEPEPCIGPTFARVPSVDNPRLRRGESITTDATSMPSTILRAPSMILRTPSMDMLVDFKALKVQGPHTRSYSSLHPSSDSARYVAGVSTDAPDESACRNKSNLKRKL